MENKYVKRLEEAETLSATNPHGAMLCIKGTLEELTKNKDPEFIFNNLELFSQLFKSISCLCECCPNAKKVNIIWKTYSDRILNTDLADMNPDEQNTLVGKYENAKRMIMEKSTRYILLAYDTLIPEISFSLKYLPRNIPQNNDFLLVVIFICLVIACLYFSFFI